MGRLEDYDGLGDEGDRRNVEERVVGEEGEGVEKYCGENEDHEEDGPDLGYKGRPWAVVSWGYECGWNG